MKERRGIPLRIRRAVAGCLSSERILPSKGEGVKKSPPILEGSKLARASGVVRVARKPKMDRHCHGRPPPEGREPLLTVHPSALLLTQERNFSHWGRVRVKFDKIKDVIEEMVYWQLFSVLVL